LALALAASAGAQQIQTINQASQSVTNIVPVYQNRAARAWLGPNGVHTLFNALNSAAANLTLALTPLLADPGAVAAVAAAVGAASCPVNPDPLVYMQNATAYQEFLCCQMAPWSMPGMPAVVQAVYSYFLPGVPDIDWSTAATVKSLHQIRALDVNITNIQRCKDDVRIHIPESEDMQARNVAVLAGTVLRSVEYSTYLFETAQPCLSASPPSACISTTPSPISAATVTSLLSFYESNSAFQRACGAATLQAFETYRTATTWCAI
jgi:hypothetical protein